MILGEEFYLDLIRPVCVTKGYLPKQIPNAADLQEDDDDEDDE